MTTAQSISNMALAVSAYVGTVASPVYSRHEQVDNAPLLGDNLALDFINTEYVVDGKRHDCFIGYQNIM